MVKRVKIMEQVSQSPHTRNSHPSDVLKCLLTKAFFVYDELQELASVAAASAEEG